MTAEMIIYEQPMNEHIRACLRLEHLFMKAINSLNGRSIWDSRTALATIINIANVLDRADLRSTLTKEIHRHRDTLQRHTQSPNIDHAALNDILGQLEEFQEKLYHTGGRLGQTIRNNVFINSIRQYLYNPGGACNFDVPAYSHWLQQPLEVRQNDLHMWFSEFDLIRHVITTLMSLIRGCSIPREEIAVGGFFQEAIDPKIPCQLIRFAIDKELNIYPEISAGRHRISVRFLNANPHGHPEQNKNDIPFIVTYCVI